ncbi:MAG: hypothetical protein ACI9DJ_001138 [Algoriphagus sp.]|jgi:hypothetical protein
MQQTIMYFTPNFLPCIAYFQEILNQDQIRLNADDIYIKQTYRNKTQILGANKVENLIVPVHASSMKTPSKDVRIDNKTSWQRNQLRTLEAAYLKSPFYQFYDYIFEPLFKNKYIFLIDLQIESLTVCLRCLQLEKTICQESFSAKKGLVDINSKVLPIEYSFKPYLQNFGNEFVPNLSVMDLLFCKGPEAIIYLRQSEQ